jgi:hypothetical protein
MVPSIVSVDQYSKQPFVLKNAMAALADLAVSVDSGFIQPNLNRPIQGF